MPRVSDLVRAAGWRQGSIARPADTRALLIASVDRVPQMGDSIVRFVAVTQDCDLVQEPGIEPFVEFVFCRETEAVEPLYRYGRNPRLLHLQTDGEDGLGPGLQLSIHDRFRVGKETLTGIAVDRDVRLEPDDTRLLSRWIAKRYTRPAFPDEFNSRLDAVDGRLERLFKSPEGQVITGVFLDVADDEFIDEVPYEIAVRITARTEAWENEGARTALLRFEERFSSILDDCQGVNVADDDIHTLPEDDLTLADFRRFRRLDKDYRSLPERAGVEQPAEGDGEL